MWIASKFGFYSIVCKNEDEFHIRARLKVDLENLLIATNIDEQIHQSDRADYRYRLVVGSDAVKKVFSILCESINYPNFKNQIAETPSQEDKLDAYHDIWSVMYREQK